MNNLLESVKETLLMGPGPSCVHETVYEAMSKYTIGHLDPHFLTIMDELKQQLQTIIGTKNRLTITMSGTGSSGMETCFVNLVEKGDPVLILINGVFGMRMQDLATRLGAEVDTLEYEWGKPVIVDDVKKKIDQKFYKIVAVVHAETSTGVRNPVEDIGKLLVNKDSIYLVDTVTSLGGIEVSADQWGVDALYSGTQKCISCPPGLSPVTFSEKAEDAIQKRKSKVPNWYLDLTMIMKYWEGESRVYHHTAPVNMLYALYQALFIILEEGLNQVYKRHLENHLALVDGLKELGIDMLVEEKYRLPMLNTVIIPENVDEGSIRKKLLEEHRIELGGGLGPLAGKIWRIGLMGQSCKIENVQRLLNILKQYL